MSAHFPADGLTDTTLNALCPLPNLWGEKKLHIWNPFHNLSSETQGWATGKTRTRQKLTSSVSPSPLAARVALAVTYHLADEREVQLQNQIRCRLRSTVEQTCKNSEQSFFRSVCWKIKLSGEITVICFECGESNTEPLLQRDIKELWTLKQVPQNILR